jgi:aspartyl-tRNA(Asn)/glutamyl-tRNA(Gln) amidotransferase subunit B
MTQSYTIVIGLEVHVQLLTQSKMFCACSTRFGAPPNTQTCPVCIGMPGVLPVMNRRAVELSVKAALALNCQIARFTKWDRKNYYYPDLPKGYQTSQYDLPLSYDGWLEIPGEVEASPPKRIGIIRAHLEEDAGKSMHDEVAGKADSRIDLNRAGTPLLEIVSQPDLRSPAEAKAYLTELKLLLTYLGVSDCNMQEGSLRVDANVNLHIDTPSGRVATPIVEVKNMNSFRAVERALTYEARRQYGIWQESGKQLGDAPKSTRGWDETAQTTYLQREKEESSDYRYFPEPDLAPVTTTDAAIEHVRASLGELPVALRARLEETYGITPYDSDVLVNQGRSLVDYYVELAGLLSDGKVASNWVQQDVLRTLNEQQSTIEQFPLRPRQLAELIETVRKGQLTTSRGREVFAEMLSGGRSLDETMKSMGIAAIDESELEDLAYNLVNENPKVVVQFKQGKEKATASLIGQAKRKNPNINPSKIQEYCSAIIPQQFVFNIRQAIRLANPVVQSGSSSVDSQAIASSLQRACLWLTPKVIEGYEPAQFAGFSEEKVANLTTLVEKFRAIATQVAPDRPASPQHVTAAQPVFATIVSMVREIVLAQWRMDLDRLFSQVELWCKSRNWPTRSTRKGLSDPLLGNHSVEQLWFDTKVAEFMLDPVGRFAPGTAGMVDLFVLPSSNSCMIWKKMNEWFLNIGHGEAKALPFNERNFEIALKELAK